MYRTAEVLLLFVS